MPAAPAFKLDRALPITVLVLAIASCADSQLYEVHDHGRLVTEHNPSQIKDKNSPLVRRARSEVHVEKNGVKHGLIHVVRDDEAEASSPAASPSFLQGSDGDETRLRRFSRFISSSRRRKEEEEEEEGEEDGGRRRKPAGPPRRRRQKAATEVGAMEIMHESEHGVVYGACKNFVVGPSMGKAHSPCPHPLSLVGCGCQDKEGESTGGCGTHFDLNKQECTAITKNGAYINAVARCCYMDWAKDFEVKTGKVSDFDKPVAGVPDRSRACCTGSKKAIGCACYPESDGSSRKNGCKNTHFQNGQCCLADNVLEGNEAGVFAEALCAEVPGSAHWEVVRTTAEYGSTNLSCTGKDLTMMSCSCGGQFESCHGGKVAGGKCVCDASNGVCNATARCAEIPIPGTDCLWADWGEWTDCTKSCGPGTQNRIRVEAMLATNGGAACTGKKNEKKACEGEATPQMCKHAAAGNKSSISESDSWLGAVGGGGSMVYIVVGVILVLCLGGGCAAYNMRGSKKGMDDSGNGPNEYGGFDGKGKFGGKGGKDKGKGKGEGDPFAG